MGCLIIIRGPAGVGKTTISKNVAKRVNAEVIHFDKILDAFGLDYIPGEKWVPLKNFLKADKLMLESFKLILKDKNLVLDGNFYHKEQIEDLIKSLKVRYFVFTLKADLQECIKRDKGRSDNIGEQAVREVFSLVSAFEYGEIVNTNNKNSEEVVNELVSKFPNH